MLVSEALPERHAPESLLRGNFNHGKIRCVE